MTSVQWCCPVFEGWFAEAGERGIAVLVSRGEGGRPVFLLQHRAVAAGLEQGVSADSPMDLVSKIEIQFCPWCGVRLRDWYRDDTVTGLAPHSAPFL